MDEQEAKKYSKYEPVFNRYLAVVTPRLGDPTYTILRSHLLFEELLRDFININLRHPKALEGARLTFAQLLAIARASAIQLTPDLWYWTALDKLNKLRNLLAHHIELQEINKKADELATFIANEIKAPLPEPTYKRTPGVAHAEREPSAIYTKIDMALVALYGAMTAGLEVEKTFNKVRQDRLAGKKSPSD